MEKGSVKFNEVKYQEINIITVNDKEYISLTDLASRLNKQEPKILIDNWMKNKEVIAFLGLWERINNPIFKKDKFYKLKSEVGNDGFKISPQKWIRETDAIGIVLKSGKYKSGVFADHDIAFEFANWLIPEFKLYLIQEFQELSKKLSYQNGREYNVNRVLNKINYSTDSTIVPTLTEEQKNFVYSDDSDVINVALFGMTAEEWRIKNPTLAKSGDIRDYADLEHLLILEILEKINFELLEMDIPQKYRLVRLNYIARKHMKMLKK